MTALALPPTEETQAASTNQPPPAADALDDQRWDACTRWERRDTPGSIGHTSLLISGMHCAACSTTIEQLLGGEPGVLEVQASAAAGRAAVRWDARLTHPSRWLPALRRAGYGAAPDLAASARELRRAEQRAALWRVFVAALCSMQVMMLAAPSYVAGPPELSLELAQVLNWGSWVLTLPVLLFSAQPLFAAAFASLGNRRVAMEVPVVLGIVVTFVASTAATFDPLGPFGSEVYFDSLTMFVSLLLAARWFEMRLRHRAAEQLEAQSDAMPAMARRIGDDGCVTLVAVQRLRAGDRVLVPAGEAFPADGALLGGTTEVDEAMLSGESRPVVKRVGDDAASRLWAGSINCGRAVEMRVEHAGSDTRLAAVAALVREALSQRPPSVRMVDRWASPFIIAVLLAAGVAAIAWSAIDPARAIQVAVAVLIVTCPCALSLAVPAAQLAAAQALARRGVVVQRLQGLDRLADVTQVVFDKTGTLTDATGGLASMTLIAGSEAEAWAHASALAQASSHPLAGSIAAAAPRGVAALRERREAAGFGTEGIDAAGRRWRLGSAVWTGVAPDRDAEYRVWLTCDGTWRAAFAIDEQPRADAAEAIAELHRGGLRTKLISGDQWARAQALAARVGIHEVSGEASPESKLAAVTEAQRRGDVVVMVGDGFNDSPVLAGADVSVAMSHGAMVSRQRADLLLASDRADALRGLAAAWQLARRARRVARQNLAWAAAYNALCIPLALAGWLPPWAAGLGMATSSLLVVANAARLSR